MLRTGEDKMMKRRIVMVVLLLAVVGAGWYRVTRHRAERQHLSHRQKIVKKVDQVGRAVGRAKQLRARL